MDPLVHRIGQLSQVAILESLWVDLWHDLIAEVVECLSIISLNAEEWSEYILASKEKSVLTKDLIRLTHLSVATALLSEHTSE